MICAVALGERPVMHWEEKRDLGEERGGERGSRSCFEQLDLAKGWITMTMRRAVGRWESDP